MGVEPHRGVDRFAPVARFPDHHNVLRRAQYRLETGAHHCVIVGQQYANFVQTLHGAPVC